MQPEENTHMYIYTHMRVQTHTRAAAATWRYCREGTSTTFPEPRGPGEVRGGSKPTTVTEAWSAGVSAVQEP